MGKEWHNLLYHNKVLLEWTIPDDLESVLENYIFDIVNSKRTRKALVQRRANAITTALKNPREYYIQKMPELKESYNISSWSVSYNTSSRGTTFLSTL